jgi:ubiquitin-like protein Pup
MSQERQQRTSTPSEADEAVTIAPVRNDLSADVDAILDEIDDVLEENAEEFVKSFVQKGGQ